MATEIVTSSVSFQYSPADNASLFSVNAGISALTATTVAQLLEGHVHRTLELCVQNGLDPDEAWILALLAEMAIGVRTSLGRE